VIVASWFAKPTASCSAKSYRRYGRQLVYMDQGLPPTPKKRPKMKLEALEQPLPRRRMTAFPAAPS
jgi:hypothetical protein